MPQNKPLLEPIDAYKVIIDQLVNDTSHGVSERLISSEGIFSKALTQERANAFVRSLDPGDRAVFAGMLAAERSGAIHDVLAVLSWWLEAGGLGFTFRGEPMPVDLSGAGLHGDYVGRQTGWDWPSDDSSVSRRHNDGATAGH